VPRKPTNRVIGSPEYERSADDRQREVLDEIRQLGNRIATTERDLADDKTTLDELIQIARRQGASWAKIGEALGISAQAAHQRAARKTAGPESRR
jgi:DNA-binding Lrp family transcriptional regulator